MAKVIQIRQKGAITIPKDIRKRYQLDENDPLTLVDFGNGFFLSPKKSVLPKLVNQIEDIREKYNITLDELIQGVQKQRGK